MDEETTPQVASAQCEHCGHDACEKHAGTGDCSCPDHCACEDCK